MKKCLSEWSEEPQDKMIKRFFALRAQNDKEGKAQTYPERKRRDDREDK